MRLNYKVIFLSAVFLIVLSPELHADNSIRGMQGFELQHINAVKNARIHSNMGNIYFEEENYISALREYQIAYNLTYNLNSSSVYLYNIAVCFTKLNNYIGAKSAIEGAIEKNPINITYYKTLVDICIKLNIQNEKLKECIADNSNPYNRIIAGLIYLKTGDKYSAKTIFDEFINLYPDMIITNDIRIILSRL